MDLFDIRSKRATHLLTGVAIMVVKSLWINGQLHFDCLVPITDDGVKWYFANATYSDLEIEIL